LRKAVFGLVIATLACESTTMPPATLDVRVEGRAERSAVVSLVALAQGSAIPADSVVWSAQPATGVEWLASDRVRLLGTGMLRLSAQARGERGSINLDVHAPPRIAFVRGSGTGRDVWSVELDGLNPSQLTSDGFSDDQLSTSQSFVYFLSARGGAPAVYRVPAGGGTSQRVTLDAFLYDNPRISPDASRLAFVRTTAGLLKLFVSDPSGSGASRAVSDPLLAGGLEAGPAWSPDGKSLAFVSTVSGNPEIYTTMIGGPSRQVTSNGATDVSPAWSHDGLRLVWVRGGSASSQLVTFDLATGAETVLLSLPGAIASPEWLPDGRLVFAFGPPASTSIFFMETAPNSIPQPVPLGAGPASGPVPIRN
jgi:Tol biopolymer transport system component